MGDDATQRPAHGTAADPGRSELQDPEGVDPATARGRRMYTPILKLGARHQYGIRRWGGLGGVALGIGLMAGGLEPMGLSLILLGTAQLLVVFEKTHPWGDDRPRASAG